MLSQETLEEPFKLEKMKSAKPAGLKDPYYKHRGFKKSQSKRKPFNKLPAASHFIFSKRNMNTKHVEPHSGPHVFAPQQLSLWFKFL